MEVGKWPDDKAVSCKVYTCNMIFSVSDENVMTARDDKNGQRMTSPRQPCFGRYRLLQDSGATIQTSGN